MIFKTFFMIAIYIVPYVLILTLNLSYPIVLLLWAIIGFGMAGIGMSVMHDGNHNAYSKNMTVNKWIGYFLNICGGYDLNWRIQHNVLHHTYTNIIGMDEDVDAGIILRFSHDQKKKSLHKFQHIYAWFIYGLLTISWLVSKDFIQLFKYNKKGLLKSQGISFTKALFTLLIWKIIYVFLILILPTLVTGNLGINIAGFFIMEFIAGFFLSTVFLCPYC